MCSVRRFKKQVLGVGVFPRVIQLRFVLQLFWKWYVLSPAARGPLSFPTWVGCCLDASLLENE